MTHGFLSLLPILLVIVLAVLTRRSFEALVAGSLLASAVLYGWSFLPKWVGVLQDALTNRDNQWVILLCGLFGSLIAMLRASRGTDGFGRIGLKLCRTERSAMLGTVILGVVIFIDDYLNMLTVGTCMRKIADKRRVPREAFSYLLDSTGTPVCVLLPFSTWAAFYAMLYWKEEPVRRLGYASGMQFYTRLIPFMFYAILTVLFVVLFALGVMPKLGPMKRAYQRVRAGGRTYSPLSASLNTDEEEIQGNGHLIDFLIPVASLIVLTLLADDILTALIITLIICLLLYVPRRVLTFGQWSNLILSGFSDMLPTLAILAGAFTMAEFSVKMHLSEYLLKICRPVMNSWTFPAVVFLLTAVLTFATSSTWGVSAIIVPIIVTLAGTVHADMILTLAALVSGSTFGSHACFYSDATVLASAGARIDNMEHASSQFPYALLAAVISFILYLLFGRLL